MIFTYIICGLFFYFFFMWLFRLVMLVITLKMLQSVKQKVEADVKEKFEKIKGEFK